MEPEESSIQKTPPAGEKGLASHVLGAAATTAAALVGAVDPNAGILTAAVAGGLTYAGDGIVKWGARQLRHALDCIQSVGEKAEEEGLDLDAVSDVMEQAIPFFSQASSDQKRAILVEIVLNAARRADEFGTQAQAEWALNEIGKLSTTAVALFGLIIERSAPVEGTIRTVEMPTPADLCVMDAAFGDARQALARNEYGHQPLIQRGDGGSGLSNPIRLTTRGFQLAKWIIQADRERQPQ